MHTEMPFTGKREMLPHFVEGFGDFATFDEAAESTIAVINDLLGTDACFIARLHRDESIVTHVYGSVPLKRGDTLHLFHTPGSDRMGHGEANEATGPALPAKEVAGAPLVVKDQLYGVLCAVRPAPSSQAGRAEELSLMMASRVLSTILTKELEAEELVRRAERAETAALVDELTGLFNRRGWDELIEREETRSARYGHRATVFMMDLDGLKQVNDGEGHAAGDALLRRAADAMRAVIREHDVGARLGGDEFAVLAVETDGNGAKELQARLEAAFAAAAVSVSIGSAHREHRGSIQLAIEQADARMYAQKAAHKRELG